MQERLSEWAVHWAYIVTIPRYKSGWRIVSTYVLVCYEDTHLSEWAVHWGITSFIVVYKLSWSGVTETTNPSRRPCILCLPTESYSRLRRESDFEQPAESAASYCRSITDAKLKKSSLVNDPVLGTPGCSKGGSCRRMVGLIMRLALQDFLPENM